ncbi:SCP2 sterol-binding domain-containing protein [Filobasidium floriforme]|uniref:SCP2 sterol-binding domain-containing protein n=1 Tax=Filobasidium floriforme TaxID=5210 RepID=UPI001E8E29B5|nr:SCP2 sterol-binding domain-containing protein [Filobasidium floriforme]KAH8089159.1 SCP2 sterol-binding domain-containing protein [Filobasidium floriforme]
MSSDSKSSQILSTLQKSFEQLSDEEKQKQVKKTNGIFQLNIKGKEDTEIWTIDMKNKGEVRKGEAGKADCTITMPDNVFVGLSEGKVNAQKAFMTGQLKVKGNIMFATKLDDVLKTAKSKL